MPTVSPEFAAEIKQSEEFDAQACMNCGVCTAVCPMGYEVLPRELFRYVVMGLRDKVREHVPTIYSCLLCKMCEANCPADVHIAENVRFLRSWVNRKEFHLS